MNLSQAYAASVPMKNTGNTTWAQGTGNYRLGAQNPHDNTFWTGSNRIALPHAVSPGEQVTFNFSFIAHTQGNHNFQWRMVNDGVAWFGEQTQNVIVEVVPPWYPPLPPPPPPCNPVYCEVPMGVAPETKRLAGAPAEKLSATTTMGGAAGPAAKVSAASATYGEVTTFRAYIDYDELGRVVARRGNNGQNVRYTYDLNGN
ncbi:MAG TPA: NBR1-Ig-like domain-containing protein, partial [Pseudoxanthomonas sp.]|nr:NBR1-Ig-like domain-containing protein [Pseudoxanthomonas sp.]